MPTIKATIDIGSSAEIVWRVLTDFSSYPKWNPYVRDVRGRPEKGQRLNVRVRMSPTKTYRFKSRVTKAIPAMELHWRRRLWVRGLCDREHAFIIVSDGIRGVHFIQRQHFSGVLAPLIFPFVQAKTLAAFERMNASLKKVAEAKR